MKKLWLSGIALLFTWQVFPQITAVTEEGKAVILFGNGTWRYLNDSVWVPHAGILSLSFPVDADVAVLGKEPDFELRYNAEKWKILPDTLYKNAAVSLGNFDGEAIAMVITEKIQFPLPTIKAAAIENFRRTGTEYKISGEQKIVVNGTEGLLLKIDALVDEVPYSYLNSYFSTPQGTLQVITFTGYNLFDRYRSNLTELISGLIIKGDE